MAQRRITRDGYVEIHWNGSFQKEHRVVAARTLGRPLRKGEEVHHKNRDKTDNSPENLQVMSKRAHCKLHAKLNRNPPCVVCGKHKSDGGAFGLCRRHYAIIRRHIRIGVLIQPAEVSTLRFYQDAAKLRYGKQTCAVCGKLFKPAKALYQKYCSPQCCKRVWQNKQPSRAKPKKIVRCSGCKQSFVRVRSDKRFCTRRCRMKTMRAVYYPK